MALACAMTLNRLITPASENAMPAWIKRTALADMLEDDFDELAEDFRYCVLDALHPHRAAIEAELSSANAASSISTRASISTI